MKMRAIRVQEFGSSEVLQLDSCVAIPSVADEEVSWFLISKLL